MRVFLYLIQIKSKFILELLRAYLFEGLVFLFIRYLSPLRRRLSEVFFLCAVPVNLRRARMMQTLIGNRSLIKGALQLTELGLTGEIIGSLQKAFKDSEELILGEFDHYGRLISEYGPIKGIACISKKDEDSRRRAKVFLVLSSRGIGIRKVFFGAEAQRRFLREFLALELLRESDARVPEIWQIDVDSLELVTTFIGMDLEQYLTSLGAKLKASEILDRLPLKATNLAIVDEYFQEGKRYVEKLSPGFVKSIYKEMCSVHQSGINIYDIKYGNVAIDYKTGVPYLIDFDAAHFFKNKKSSLAVIERDRDIEKFNNAFGEECLTYDRLKIILSKRTFPAAEKTYSSTYIGYGLRLGHLWDRSIGFGRWHFILEENLKNLKGMRVLSLGSNNASIELLMLRAGASEVVAFEQDNDFIEQGKFLLKAVEWADNKKYNLKYVKANMATAVTIRENFDLAIALCSLYYLTEKEMRLVIYKLKELAPRFIFQCNIQNNIGREDLDQYRRASLEFAKTLLADAGYAISATIAPYGYSRPLVCGDAPITNIRKT